MNIRKLTLPLGLVALITACDGLKDALTAHTDVAARVERRELSVNQLGNLLGNTTLQIQPTREIAGVLSELWMSYHLLALAAARHDTLSDPKLIDEATLGITATSRLRRFMEKVSAGFKVDSGSEAVYAQAPGGLFAARHILFQVPGGATQQQKDSVRRIAEGVRARVTSANFAEMAKRYSADPGSKDRGGDLGTFRREEMVKPFSDATAALKPGDISPLVETSFGYHIVQRQTYANAKQSFDEQLRGISMQRADSVFSAKVEADYQLKVKSNAATVTKNVARDLGSHRKDNEALATYKGGELTVGRLVTWIESYPQARLARQIQDAPDSVVKEFVKSIARNEVLLKMADSAGVTVDTAEQTRVRADFKQLIGALWAQIGVDPTSLDSARSVPERENLAATRVDAYLERVMQGQANPLQIPPPAQYVLMSKYESKLYPAGIDRALERGRKIKASVDSTRVANQAPSQVPLPTPPVQTPRPDSVAGGKRP